MSESSISREVTTYLARHSQLTVSPVDYEILEKTARLVDLDERDVLLSHGEPCLYLPFVLQGSIKVTKSSENAREIVLYYIREEGSCILSALGILNGTAYPANALCENKARILLVPSAVVKDFVNRYEGWRNFIFQLYNSRFHQLLEFIDEILFTNLDTRLVRFLLSATGGDSSVRKTHQQIAEELGSSREVISRLLKDMEKADLLKLGRGNILVTNEQKLKKRYLM
ncbi:Crp/Fnr family transcriptional regulator [Spirochaeta isovalerica]|uniref:CRP/FNR family transcriptional regulator n=1 Tax=Spirochaeta isovalerica TaxID=150 RepID=A0A841RCR7_9SPIO|nr:Crp/Fnr family transcriptional regulator [Spirochaeta isovalerica]MBB6480659.1 CRP/FNR family transcriptional regulator [Spirochaeta isovalerica]